MNKMDKFKLVALMEKNGYVFGNEVLPKLVGCFYEAGLRTDGMVPAALLSGLPGAVRPIWLNVLLPPLMRK